MNEEEPHLQCSRMSNDCKVSKMPLPGQERSTVPKCGHYKTPVLYP